MLKVKENRKKSYFKEDQIYFFIELICFPWQHNFQFQVWARGSFKNLTDLDSVGGAKCKESPGDLIKSLISGDRKNKHWRNRCWLQLGNG